MGFKKSRWDQSQPSEPEERDLLHIPPPAFHLYIYTSLSLSLSSTIELATDRERERHSEKYNKVKRKFLFIYFIYFFNILASERKFQREKKKKRENFPGKVKKKFLTVFAVVVES